MEYRFPVPVGTVPAKSQTLQQGIGIRKACAGLTDMVGIGAQGDDLAAAAVVKLQHRRPFFNGMSLGGVEFDAAAGLDQGLK